MSAWSEDFKPLGVSFLLLGFDLGEMIISAMFVTLLKIGLAQILVPDCYLVGLRRF